MMERVVLYTPDKIVVWTDGKEYRCSTVCVSADGGWCTKFNVPLSFNCRDTAGHAAYRFRPDVYNECLVQIHAHAPYQKLLQP
jgi:hypothetical protein